MFGITTLVQYIVLGVVLVCGLIVGYALTSAWHGVFIHPALVQEAKSGYVLETTLRAAEAKIKERERQLEAAVSANNALRIREQNRIEQEEQRIKELESQIEVFKNEELTKPDSNRLSQSDIDFLLKH